MSWRLSNIPPRDVGNYPAVLASDEILDNKLRDQSESFIIRLWEGCIQVFSRMKEKK